MIEMNPRTLRGKQNITKRIKIFILNSLGLAVEHSLVKLYLFIYLLFVLFQIAQLQRHPQLGKPLQ